uniref:type II secretion system F family protein n=1 Tax=Burkholderia arboris TaxID=488730 RepID=UPI003BEEE2AF
MNFIPAFWTRRRDPARIDWPLRRQFYEDAEVHLRLGTHPTEALEQMAVRLARRHRGRAAEAFRIVRDRIEDGKRFVDAFGENLSALEKGALAVGELRGNLPDGMALVLEVREMADGMKSQFLARLASPATLFVLVYATLIMIGAMIVPQFEAMLPASKWRGMAAPMAAMGIFATGWGLPVTTIGCIVLAIASWLSLTRWTGPTRDWFDRYIPPWSLYRITEGFAWLLSYSALVRAHIPDTEALRGQIESASPWLRSKLEPVLDHVEDGKSIAQALRLTGLGFPSEDLIDAIESHAEKPGFAERIVPIARAYAKQVMRRMTWTAIALSGLATSLTVLIMIVLQLGTNALSSQITAAMSGYQ